jgi:hypothetical protein
MDNLVYQSYLATLTRTLLERGTLPERVPRVLENGVPERWVYVWDDEAEARAFVEKLRESFDGPPWHVRATEVPPSVGPLTPLQLEVGRLKTGWVFGLDPLACSALRRRYPHACRYGTVVIRPAPGEPIPWADLAHLADLVLPILTGLSTEELAPFGSYQVIDPVTGTILLPPALFHAPGAAPVTSGPSAGG